MIQSLTIYTLSFLQACSETQVAADLVSKMASLGVPLITAVILNSSDVGCPPDFPVLFQGWKLILLCAWVHVEERTRFASAFAWEASHFYNDGTHSLATNLSFGYEAGRSRFSLLSCCCFWWRLWIYLKRQLYFTTVESHCVGGRSMRGLRSSVAFSQNNAS